MNNPLELSFALMDAPFESARSTTALRLLAIAARRGCRIRVFAYEGAVMQTFARQQRHANAVHGRSAEEENHFLPKEAIGALIDEAARHGGSLDWVNCGLCAAARQRRQLRRSRAGCARARVRRLEADRAARIERDLASLIAKGGSVYALGDDLEQRGLDGAGLVEGVRPLPMPLPPAFLGGYDRVWHW